MVLEVEASVGRAVQHAAAAVVVQGPSCCTSYRPSASACQTWISAAASGWPLLLRTWPRTQQGSPGRPWAMSAPSDSRGASSTWKGPSTVASVQPGGAALVHAGHQHRQAQRVGQQHQFLPPVAAPLAGFGEKADAGRPLVLGQPHLARKAVQVLHQRRHDVAQPGVGCLRVAGDHGLGDGVFVDVAHGPLGLLAPGQARGRSGVGGI
jgi:hypothetical protein